MRAVDDRDFAAVDATPSTRERIIAAAGDCVDRLGVERATVAAIAESAELHRVTVYRHFADREAIIVELLDRRSAPILAHASARFLGAEPLPDVLVDAMAGAVYEVRTSPGLPQVMGLWTEGGSFRSAGMSERFLRSAVDVTAPYLLQAQKLGQVRQDMDVQEMVEWLLDSCIMLLLFKSDLELDELRRHIRTFVLPAIQPPS